MKNGIQTTAAKQEYQAPQLSELGNLTDLTRNASGGATDAGTQSTQ